MKQEICLFVYGTLMTGGSNEHKLPKDARRVKAKLKGFRIDTTKVIPKLFYDDESEVTGELVTCTLSK